MPPPIYGVTVVNKQVYESASINEDFETRLLQVNYSKSLSDLKKINAKKIVALIGLWLKLIYQLISFRPNYVYYTIPPAGLGFYKELLNILTLKLFRVKPIYHLHGKGIEKAVNSKFKRSIHQFCFSNAIVIHLSDGLCKSEFKNLKLKKTSFYAAPNGIQKAESATRKDENVGKVELLFLSNIQESKGIFLLLDVFPQIIEKYPNTRLNIIGGFRDDTTKSRFLDFIEKTKIGSNVFHWGEKHHQEKHDIIAKCDIHVHPSLNDAFPLVILEAMQQGLAIVASDQGSIPEIINSNFGFVFPTNDKVKLFECLEKLITNDELRRSMRENAKIEFNNLYTLEKFEERMTHIFKSL